MPVNIYGSRTPLPPFLFLGPWANVPRAAWHQVGMFCNLLRRSLKESSSSECLWFLEFVSTLCFVPLFNVWALTQKGKECKRGCTCCQMMFKKKKNLRLICTHAEGPQNLSTTKPHQSWISLPTFPITSQTSGCHFVTVVSPFRLPNICFPLISPVQK